MNTSNTFPGNKTLIEQAISELQNYSTENRNNDKIFIEFLIKVLSNEDTRNSYMKIKSITVLINSLESYQSSIEKLTNDNLENLISNIKNHFLVENLEIYLDYEVDLIKNILSGENKKIKNNLFLVLQDLVKDLINNTLISANKETLTGIPNIQELLEDKLKKEITKLKELLSAKNILFKENSK